MNLDYKTETLMHTDFKNIKNGKGLPNVFKDSILYDLINKMISFNANERPNAIDI